MKDFSKCKKCGMCCRAIWINRDYKNMLNMFSEYFADIPDEKVNENDGDLSFIYKHWTHISDKEAAKLNPWMYTWNLNELEHSFWTCDCLNKETNLCTVHSHSPHVCREFPYYDRDKLPETFKFYSNYCGFNTPIKEGYHV